MQITKEVVIILHLASSVVLYLCTTYHKNTSRKEHNFIPALKLHTLRFYLLLQCRIEVTSNRPTVQASQSVQAPAVFYKAQIILFNPIHNTHRNHILIPDANRPVP